MALVTCLPEEILSHIATFLNPTDLRACNTVCEQLGSICRDYCLWRRFFVDINTSCPEGRLCHTAVVNNNKMYIFGGHITQPASEYFHSVKQDLHEYDLLTREWKELPGGADAPKRTEHTTVVHNNTMIVFGGYSGTGYENTAMVYDFLELQWRTLAPTGEAPSPRSAHTAVMVGDSMFVFGGWNGLHCMNDLHELNLVTNQWLLISADTSPKSRASGSANHAHSIFAQRAAAQRPSGDFPSARCSHGAVIMPRGANNTPVMFIFGGYAIDEANESPNKGYLNDLYEFHFATKTWACTKTRGTLPCPRSRFRMIPYGDSIYLFAGWNSTKHFSTLHRFDANSKQWAEVETTFDNDGIGQFSMIESNGIMYVYSGYSPKAGCRTNLYAYPLAPVVGRQAH